MFLCNKAFMSAVSDWWSRGGTTVSLIRCFRLHHCKLRLLWRHDWLSACDPTCQGSSDSALVQGNSFSSIIESLQGNHIVRARLWRRGEKGDRENVSVIQLIEKNTVLLYIWLSTCLVFFSCLFSFQHAAAIWYRGYFYMTKDSESSHPVILNNPNLTINFGPIYIYLSPLLTYVGWYVIFFNYSVQRF